MNPSNQMSENRGRRSVMQLTSDVRSLELDRPAHQTDQIDQINQIDQTN